MVGYLPSMYLGVNPQYYMGRKLKCQTSLTPKTTWYVLEYEDRKTFQVPVNFCGSENMYKLTMTERPGHHLHNLQLKDTETLTKKF